MEVFHERVSFSYPLRSLEGGQLRQEQSPHSTLLAMPMAASYEGLHQAQSPVPYQDLHSSIT